MIEYIFKLSRTDKDGTIKNWEIDLYDITGVFPYAHYDRWESNWIYDQADVYVNKNGEEKRYILNIEEAKELLEIANTNPDSFDWISKRLFRIIRNH